MFPCYYNSIESFSFERLLLKLYHLEKVKKGYISSFKINTDVIQIDLHFDIPIQKNKELFIKQMEKYKIMNVNRFEKYWCYFQYLGKSENDMHRFKGIAKKFSIFTGL